VLGGGPDDAVLPDPIRVSVSKLLARSGATPVCLHGPESAAPTAPMTGKEFTGSADERTRTKRQPGRAPVQVHGHQWHHCAVGATGTVRDVLRNILGNSRWET